MKTTICKILNEIGVPFNLSGREYLETAIEIALNKGKMGITKELYPMVAEKHGTKPLRVERGIRVAIERTFSNVDTKRIDDFFGNTVSINTGKLTNSEFIYGIVKHIQIYG